MKFVVTRTSSWHNEKPPCEGAKKERVDRIETRTCSEEDFDRKFSSSEGLWRSKGCDHSVTDEGYIKRIHKDDVGVWMVDFSDLDSLMSFYHEHGNLVIDSCWSSGLPQVEIYDDYRE